MNALNYWWNKYTNIKEKLSKYMRENKIATVEEAIDKLLDLDR